jgi:phytoene desaturase
LFVKSKLKIIKQKVNIIGSGVAGMASAIRLACYGFEVTVFERNLSPGGKLTELTQGGYRFDKGPSLFTMPDLIEELKSISDFKENFNYHRLNILTNYFFEDGTKVIATQSIPDFAEELSKKLKEEKSSVIGYLQRSAAYYKLTAGVFLEQSISRPGNFLNVKTLSALFGLFKLKLHLTMDEQNSRSFKNQKTVQLFNRYATYNGSSPYKAPALLTMIPHLEFGMGAYLPESGMYQITDYLYRMALHCGVNFKFGESVEKITVAGKKAEGIVANGTFYKSDIVLSDADINFVYKYLLDPEYTPKKLVSQEKSSSAYVFYWGVKKTFDELDLHNILFSDNYEEEFRWLFEEDKPYDDPTVYINITSKFCKNDAPADSENWFVMVNVPHNSSGNNISYAEALRKNTIAKINRVLKTDIEKFIEVESVLTPVDIEKQTSSVGGSLYGNASNNKFSAFLRHPNFSRKIKGLYFAGGSVHPGGGIPLCLMSAKIASQMINKNYSA